MIIQTTKEMRPRDQHDFYPTPLELCRQAVKLLQGSPWDRPTVLDPGSGAGPWGEALKKRWHFAQLIGVDIRELEPAPDYDFWITADFLTLGLPQDHYDIVLGNPPFKFAEGFVRKALGLVCLGGQVLFLFRNTFLGSEERLTGKRTPYPEGLWSASGGMRPMKVYQLDKRPSFTGNNKTDASEYMLFHWIKGYRGPVELDWLHWRD